MWVPTLGYLRVLSFKKRWKGATLSTLAAQTKTFGLLTKTHDAFGFMDLQVLGSRWLQHMQRTVLGGRGYHNCKA